MSAISNYIHLERENYLEYGTYKITENRSNYSNAVYARFREKIRQISQKFRVQESMEALSTQFNEDRNTKIQYLKELQSRDPASYTDFIRLVLKTADLDKKYNAEQVAKILTIDDSTGTLKLDSIMNRAASSQTRINIPKITSEWSDINTLLSHLDTCDQKINLLTDESTKKWLHLKVRVLRIQLQKIAKDTLEEHQTLQRVFTIDKQSGRTVKRQVGETGVSAEVFGQQRVRLRSPLNKDINKEIIQIASMANISGVMSNIKGSFDEVLGAIAAPLYDNVTDETLQDFVQELQQLFASSHVPQGSQTATMQLTAQEIALSKELNQQELKKSQYKYVVKGVDDRLTFALDYETKNKADFSIIIDGKEMGVSAKAVDLSKTTITTKDGATIPAHISLQTGTNLLAYLLKAETVQSKIGTHFLNVYATLGTENNPLLQEAANSSLTFYLLYTALSGDILKSKGNAGLLYVYDTGKKMSSGVTRVHFFSITSLLESMLEQKGLLAPGIDIGLSNFDDMIYINPTLHSVAARLSIANQKVTEYDNVGANISARLTKVLGSARTTTLSIGLLNTFMNKAIAI